MDKTLIKVFNELKQKCKTRQQRIAFNTMLDSFAKSKEYKSLEDIWVDLVSNNAGSKSGIVNNDKITIKITSGIKENGHIVNLNILANGELVGRGMLDYDVNESGRISSLLW